MLINMKLNEWMKFVFLVPVSGAERYSVGQPLTEEQPVEIMHMIEEAAECDLTSLEARTTQLDRGEPYRTFLECYLNLMIEGGTITWRRKLWNVLADVDKRFMKNYTKQLFHLDIETLV